MSRAVVIAAPVSFKKSVEVCSFIRGKKVSSAIAALSKAALMEIAIPFRKFNRGGVGHRPGMGTGRFPVNACKQIINLLNDAQANAQHKGLDTGSLVIRHISAKKAEKSFHYGRKRRRLMKRTHIEVVLEQREIKAKEKTKTKAEKSR